MKSFNRKLGKALSEDLDAGREAGNPLSQVRDLSTQIQTARDSVADLERQHAHSLERLNGHLAVGVKQAHSRLDASLKNGSCVVGYRSKQLRLKPDFDTGTWAVSSPDAAFARRFARNFGPATALTDDTMPLVRAILKFFTGHYRTL